MKLDAIGVTSKNFKETVRFYELLGFKFPEITLDTKHLEAMTVPGAVRLMIDNHAMMVEINGTEPMPSSHSTFAMLGDSPKEVDEAVKKISEAGFKIVKEPWDAFWGQRYAVVSDPDGYLVDLFAQL